MQPGLYFESELLFPRGSDEGTVSMGSSKRTNKPPSG
jgi:hypothetical protein